MPRPLKERIITEPPQFSSFKPIGVRAKALPQILLSIDEYEAIRLADFSGLDHTQAAVKMEISRSTFTRLVEKARKKIADFLVNGAILQIEGGNIHFRDNLLRCNNCESIFRVSFDTEIIKCPNCGAESYKDYADQYGHGRCCRGHGNQNGKRR